MPDKVIFRTTGPFRVTAPDGTDLTPRLAKAHGLLLLLVTGAEGARGRAWVQDCLWSDRAPEQASASLRQTLSVIRRSFGPWRDLLTADRRQLALDMTRIAVEDTAGADFAEGLDLRDAEFDSWLAAERARRGDGAAPQPDTPRPDALAGDVGRDRIGIIVRGDGSDIADWTGQVLADGLFLSLNEFAHVDVFRREEDSVTGDPPLQIVLELSCLRCGTDGLAIRLAVLSGQTRRQIWSGQSRARLQHGVPPIDDIDVLRLTHSAVEAVTADRGRSSRSEPGDHADELLRHALVKIFSMRADHVAEADALLQAAQDRRASPLYRAWQLQIRTIQRLERHTLDEQRLRQEGEALAAQAMEDGSGNSMVLALLANAHLFLFGDPATSLLLGRQAVERNPGNAMAAWALSSARLYNGDTAGAYRDAVRGRQMAMQSPRRFFWDLQQAATAMLLGRTEECMALLRGALLQRPHFRPPLRYLIGLEASLGHEAAAQDHVARLQALEPDFSAERLFKDGNYPASLVHRTSLIRPDSVLALR